ncbi:MAG TPA: tetratricopeptide repeat protein [Anaerolineales bacterium]|nr:tetratricopeptide repeat protein [Anaerolineales bacterium]
MACSISLHKSLRRIPEFRSLSTRELDMVVAQIIVKKYRSGQVLWRTEKRQDFWVVVQDGEIALERRSHGMVTHRLILTAGEYIDAGRWKLDRDHTSIARALTDSKLYIIWRGQLAALSSKSGHPTASRPRAWIFRILWSALVAVLILAFGWRDISRILSGSVFMAAQWRISSSFNLEGSVPLLGIAEFLDPSASFAHNRQGYLWFQQGDLLKAADSFAAAVGAEPASGAALNNQAVTYFTRGDIQQAVQIQRWAVERNPDNAMVHYNLGIMLMKLGKGRDALREFREAGYIQPDWALPHLQQAYIHLQSREYDQAEEAAGEATRLDPGQAAGHIILAIALYEQARDAEALGALDTALRLSPQERVPEFYKALIRGREGRSEEALKALNQLLRSTTDPLDAARITAEIRFLEGPGQNSIPPPH